MFILFKPGERAISRPFQTKRPVSVPGRVTSPRSPPWPETVLFRPPLFPVSYTHLTLPTNSLV